MARTKGMLSLSGNLEVNAQAPLDARTIVPTEADLTVASNFPYPYIGLEVYVIGTGKKYRLVNLDTTQSSSWHEIAEGGGGSGVREYFSRIPEMTSETAPMGVVSASSEVYDCKAFECMNGSPSSEAHHRWAGTYSAGAYIQYKFVTPTIINRLNIIPGGAASEPVEATSVTLQASNDGTTFTDLGTWDIAVGDYNKTFLRTFNNTTEYLYYRLKFNARTWRVNGTDYAGLRQYQLDTGFLV